MNHGDVVELDWPYSDFTGSKFRPAVVVQADFLNGILDDTILIQITSTRHGIPGMEVFLTPARLCQRSSAVRGLLQRWEVRVPGFLDSGIQLE
jgi:mRNA-degrading endonuclease toxin of MazEF toxin-antitoxin module